MLPSLIPLFYGLVWTLEKPNQKFRIQNPTVTWPDHIITLIISVCRSCLCVCQGGCWYQQQSGSWTQPWCTWKILGWLPLSSSMVPHLTISCSGADHQLCKHPFLYTSTHPTTHFYSHWWSLGSWTNERPPQSHQDQLQCLFGHLFSTHPCSWTEQICPILEWSIGQGTTWNFSLYMCNWPIFTSCQWTISMFNGYCNKVSGFHWTPSIPWHAFSDISN